MSTAALFERLAPRYDELWTGTPVGRAQRDAVWRVIDGLFHNGDRVLDLGCGTGEDALHLAARGVRVHAIDASPAMVAQARARGVPAEVGHAESVGRAILPADPLSSGARPPGEAACGHEWPTPLSFPTYGQRDESWGGPPGPLPTPWSARPNTQPLHSLREERDEGVPRGPGGLPHTFDGVLSNFGALNCVADLVPVAHALGGIVRPRGYAAICTIGRFCAWELLYPRKAFRRWPGRAGDVYYPTVRELRAIFARDFELLHWYGIGMVVPPSYVKLPPAAVRLLARLETPMLRSCADHRLLVFRRK